MYREWKKTEFPKQYYIWIWKQQDSEVQHEIDGRIVGREGWQEKVYNRKDWKKLLRTANNRRILHMPMEWMYEWMNPLLTIIWISYKCLFQSCETDMYKNLVKEEVSDPHIFCNAALKNTHRSMQSEHSYGDSPVWRRRCSLKWDGCRNLRPQSAHVKRVWFEWINMW